MSTEPLTSSEPARPRATPDLRVIESRQWEAKLHVLTYVVGNAAFWTLWAAVSVSADTWYWWWVVPFAGWTIVLALHVGHASRVSNVSRRTWTPRADGASSRVRAAALLLIAGLLAGPVGTHVYWALGGTWGLHQSTSAGIRVVAVLVVVLLVTAVLVVLARVGLWRQAFVSDRLIRFSAWALAGVFLLETLAALTWSRGEPEWWLYGPVSLVIALLALIVAGSGGAWPRTRGPHQTVPSH